MLLRLIGRVAWFAGRITVKYVLVPIAISAITAVALEKLGERLETEPSPKRTPAKPRKSAKKKRKAPATRAKNGATTPKVEVA